MFNTNDPFGYWIAKNTTDASNNIEEVKRMVFHTLTPSQQRAYLTDKAAQDRVQRYRNYRQTLVAGTVTILLFVAALIYSGFLR